MNFENGYQILNISFKLIRIQRNIVDLFKYLKKKTLIRSKNKLKFYSGLYLTFITINVYCTVHIKYIKNCDL